MEFEPEDFINTGMYSTKELAAHANAKLKEWLDKAPVVYGKKDPESGLWVWGEQPTKDDTHSSRTLCIEPIVRDSLEKLAADIAAETTNVSYPLKTFIARARKLLEAK